MTTGIQQKSLRHQAFARIAAVFLIIGGISAALFWVGWSLVNDRLLYEQAESTARTVEARMSALQSGWQRETDALAAQITFNRMLDGANEDRWLKLRAYIVALGETLDHGGLVIVDKQGRPVFEFGNAGPEFATVIKASTTTAPHHEWYLSQDKRRLFRVLHAPLWLGLNGGHGSLILLKHLDNLQLAAITSSSTPVRLAVNSLILASSAGIKDVGNRAHPHPGPMHVGPEGGLCRDIPLGLADSWLHVNHNLPQTVSPTQFALAAVVLAAALGMGLYVALGDWIRRNVRRVETLSEIADRFRQHHALDQEIHSRLEDDKHSNDELVILNRALLELMQTSQARDEESRAYLQTLEILEEAVVEVDWEGRLLRSSPAWDKLVGSDMPRSNLYECLDPEDRENLRYQLSELCTGVKGQVSARLRVASPQRSGTWLECRFVPVDQPVTRIRGVLRDVTQTYLQEKHITHMALHDALTRLPNRILLEDRLKFALRMATREKNKVGIGFIDLDHFKNVNDVLGHKFGDKLLVTFAENLRATLRGVDTLARWGGDEFVVLLPSLDTVEDIRHVAEKLVKASRDSVQIEGQSLPVTFSLGFSIFPDDGENIEILLSQADRAMFYAKAQGRNMVQFFCDMTRKGLGKKELYIQSRLGAAIDQRQIQAWFQPLVDSKTHRVIGLEALARWQDPELGWISPSTFIPMAENLGLIAELGDLVLAHALTMGRRLRDAGHDLLLSVNISKRQLYMPDCAERLLRDSQIAGIDPGRIMLEITESVAMSEVDFAMERLRSLHEAGFKMGVDDFGVGYSSLSQLHEMPVDEIKIDISFTRRVLEPQGARLIQAIVGMAQALHIETVAEGVEDADTARILTELGVHQLQGYYFGKPMPEQEFEVWLDAQQD
ncbi:MAG: bifunctional diguanylate cyclase/phosphodiesterase [Thiobacillus sp.]|nr:bifunctional diguanylate cyclase/phosphodiesterase [Thiobacillus sp.]